MYMKNQFIAQVHAVVKSRKSWLFLALFLFTAYPASAEYIIHVQHPWADDEERKDTLWMMGNNIVGYYPGTKMVNEGGGWFSYMYNTLDKTQSNRFQIVSYIPTIYDIGAGALYYPANKSNTYSIDSLFNLFSPKPTEIWIYITDPSKKPEILDHPKNGKVINLFNPWPDNSSQIIIGNGKPFRMIMRQDICGWYTYYFAAPVDSLSSVQFTDYFHKEKYTSLGLKAGTPIDLSVFLASQDTVYILPQPFPLGAPVLTAKFPGKTGECGFRKVSAIFRDWKLDDISFYNNPTGMNGGGSKNMVQKTLTGPDYKPKKTTDKNVSTQYADSLNTWFKTITFPSGRTNDTCIDLTLLKSDDGRWTFDSDKLGGFFPLDSFNNPNNIKYYDRIDPKDPTGKMRNFHFTMEMHLQFVYHQGADLEFMFRGDDDVWIFVNNNLAIDLGGLHEWASDTLILDQDRTKLGLVDGQSYAMDIFYCERNPVSSNLLIKTTMDLHNSDELYYKEKVLGSGKIQYDIWQRLKIEGPDCGFTPLLNAETLATVTFIMDGPGVIAKELSPGTYYGGILVDPNKSRVTLDSTKIDGLVPGEYRITYESTFDKERKGYLVFVVPPFPPDHLDIIPASVELDLSRDQPVDSIFLPIEIDETQPYAVFRDKNGYFLDNAANQKWVSRDTSVITVKAPSPTDPSRCIVTKTGTGTTWLVVSDPKGKLKPDSIKITAVYKPKFPAIVSAVMLDADADVVPDMIAITLADTFKAEQRLDSVVLNYRGHVYILPAAQATIRGTSIIAPFTSLSGADGRPAGQAALVGVIGTEVSRKTKEISDGVTPAVIAADVLENESAGPDTLFLTFSEPVLISTVLGKQLLLIKANTTDTVALDVQKTVTVINDSTLAVAIAVSAKRPQPGDLLRLLPGTAGGTIADSSKNTPHLLNRSVVIGFRAGPTSVAAAYYLDANADGFVDKVIAVFKRPVKPADMKTVKVQWSSVATMKSETVAPDALVKLSDSVWCIPVHGESLTPNVRQTSGPMELSVEYAGFPNIFRSSSVADSAAPVIVSAALSYGNAVALDSALSVVFSEPLLAAPGEQPFLLWSKRYSAQYRFRLSLKSFTSATCEFIVDAVVGGAVSFASQGDSIWIDVAANIADAAGNIQDNPANRRVLLTVSLPQPAWIPTLSANPFIPGQTGTEISVQSKAPIIDPDRFSSRLSIYDAVGNQVLSADMPQKNKGFALMWTGRNKNARIVGVGVYPAVIRISENGAEVWKKVLKIGVKK